METIHLWHHCHGCGAAPIAGPRHTCTSCPLGPHNDLCAACYRRYRRGELVHPASESLAAQQGTAPTEHIFQESAGRPRSEVAPWLDVPFPQATPPTVASGFVVRPEFLSGYLSTFGSFAFTAHDGENRLALTALHVMDEMIKEKNLDLDASNPSITGRELPAVVDKVRLYDVFAPTWVLAELGLIGPMRVLPEARVNEEEPFCQGDVAAFDIPDSALGNLMPAPLAEQLPDVGDPVWIAAPATDGRRVIDAVVVHADARALIFRDANPDVRPPYSSGAPIINAAGEVVGINIGAGTLDDAGCKHGFGHACHVMSIRRHLG